MSGADVRILVRGFSSRVVFTSNATIDGRMSNASGLEARAEIPANFLRPHKYVFSLAVIIPDVVTVDLVPEAFAAKVIDGGSKWAKSEGYDYRCVFADCGWSFQRSN